MLFCKDLLESLPPKLFLEESFLSLDLLLSLPPFFSKQSLQYIGFSPIGLKGTWQSLPHSSHTASCNKGLLESLPPKLLLEESLLSLDLLSDLNFFINISTKY